MYNNTMKIEIKEIEYTEEALGESLPRQLFMDVDPDRIQDDQYLDEMAQETIFEQTGYNAEDFMLVY